MGFQQPLIVVRKALAMCGHIATLIRCRVKAILVAKFSLDRTVQMNLFLFSQSCHVLRAKGTAPSSDARSSKQCTFRLTLVLISTEQC